MAPDTLVLRDVHVPPAPSWWPPAPGWWLLAGVVVLVLLGIAAWRWHRRRCLQRWQRWFDAVPQGRAPAEQVAAASDLLRRAARRVSPGADLLEGEAWLQFLDGEQGRAFSEGPGRLLLDGGYRRTVDASELEVALAVARAQGFWLGARAVASHLIDGGAMVEVVIGDAAAGWTDAEALTAWRQAVAG